MHVYYCIHIFSSLCKNHTQKAINSVVMCPPPGLCREVLGLATEQEYCQPLQCLQGRLRSGHGAKLPRRSVPARGAGDDGVRQQCE